MLEFDVPNSWPSPYSRPALNIPLNYKHCSILQANQVSSDTETIYKNRLP